MQLGTGAALGLLGSFSGSSTARAQLGADGPRVFSSLENPGFWIGAQGQGGAAISHFSVNTKNSSSINGKWVMLKKKKKKVVDVGFTSSNKELGKSKFILLLFGCFFQPSSVKIQGNCSFACLVTLCPPPPSCAAPFQLSALCVPGEMNGLKWMFEPKPQL